ncbi:MAG: hypothetical protein KF773_42325 [Deltaproteobacteria bacterium]|nr:hypothetical protein [Deltaproteobacteria bacterium]
MRASLLTGLLLTPLFLVAACAADDEGGADDGEDCSDGHCDVFTAKKLKTCKTAADFKTTDGSLKCTPCAAALADRSGRGFIPAFTANDALLKKVYMTFEDTNGNKKIDTDEITCPVDMPGIMAKLEKVDTNSCNGISTRVVSETAAKLGEANADYRAVTSRDCDNRGDFGLLFSSFGFSGDNGAKGSGTHISEDGHPGEVEAIAFDDVDGVFNYYKELDGKMTFFGSSADFVVHGPGGPGLTNTLGCANCHPGGGLNMKELQSPWTHWSLEDNIRGADKLVQNRAAYLGTLQSGADMQFQVTQAGNDKWAASKAKLLGEMTTTKLQVAKGKFTDDRMSAAEKADLVKRGMRRDLHATQLLLEPLFCTKQVNLNNSGGGSAIPGNLFATNRHGLRVSSKSFASADLAAALTAIGSNVPDVAGANELTTPFMTLEPSHEDEAYINALVAAGILDQNLVRDILMVDFTRPVLSDDRCGLLSFVPDLEPGDRKAAQIRDAILGALEREQPAAGSPGAQLLAHLKANQGGTPVDHRKTLQTYSSKCQARDAKQMVRDGLRLRSLHTQVVFGEVDARGSDVHAMSVFEFPNTMPRDNVRVVANAAADNVTQISLGSRWSPVDCTIVNGYVPPPAN